MGIDEGVINSMKCIKCGNDIPEGKRFCKYCGTPVKVQTVEESSPVTGKNPLSKRCKKCGAPLLDGFAFCDQCGAPIEEDMPRIRIIISVLLFIVLLAGIVLFVYKTVGNGRAGDIDGENVETAIDESTLGNTEQKDATKMTSGTATQQNMAEVTSDTTTQQDMIESTSDTTTQQDMTEVPTDTPVTELEVDTITAQTSVGDFVYYGTYEQNNNDEDGKERIEWLVLDEEDGRYLLITSEVIDCVCYNNVWRDTAWGNCSLRDWLNTSFLTEAFTENQINSIAYSEHTDEDGNSASDQVFILNAEELRENFNSNNERTAGATPYAEAKGVYVYSNGNCWWWVSDAGADPHYARYVNCEGAILEYGMLVFNNVFGVRPAIWIKK